MKQMYLISSDGCVKCMMMKQYLSERNVAFTICPVTSLIAKDFLRCHDDVTELPILVNPDAMNGFITGFNPVEIDKFLGRDA